MTSEDAIEIQVRLARMRTALAERRTHLAEVQLASLLITLPLTIHAGVVVLSGTHELAQRLHLLMPFWLVLATMVLAGALVLGHALHGLLQVHRTIRELRDTLPEEPPKSSPNKRHTHRSARDKHVIA